MATIGNITFATESPGDLVEFWVAALDYEQEKAPPGLLEAIADEGGDVDAAAAVQYTASRIRSSRSSNFER